MHQSFLLFLFFKRQDFMSTIWKQHTGISLYPEETLKHRRAKQLYSFFTLETFSQNDPFLLVLFILPERGQRGRASHPHTIYRHYCGQVFVFLFFFCLLSFLLRRKPKFQLLLMAFLPGHTFGQALSPKTSPKHRDAWESETGTMGYFSSRAFCFHLPLLLNSLDMNFRSLAWSFSHWRIYPSSLLFSGLGSWHLCENGQQHVLWFCLPLSARLTDVVSGALGSGAREAESSVIISCRPESDQNDRGSSHQSVTGRPQQKGGGGLLPFGLTTLRKDTFLAGQPWRC